MNNIYLDAPVHMPISDGVREALRLAHAGIDHGGRGWLPASEDPCYGACYASASLLAAAQRCELVVSAGAMQDESGAVVGHWVLYGLGAPDMPAEPMEMAELCTLMASGLRLYSAYGHDLTDTVYTLH